MEKVNLGEFIYQRRKSLGLSQKDIADFLAISVSSVFKWEKNERLPDLTLFGGLAKILKVDIESLVDCKEALNNSYDDENEFNIEAFSKFFATQRKINNYSLTDLSEKLNISYQTISKWEKQESLPNIYTLKQCSELFHISLVELYYGKSFYTVEQNNKALEKHNKKKLYYILACVVLIIGVFIGVVMDRTSNDSNSSINNLSSIVSNDVNSNSSSSIEESVSESISTNNSSTGSDTSIQISDDFVVEETEKGLRLLKYKGYDRYITIPEPITIIGESAFYNSNIKEINLSTTLIEIEDEAFHGCGNLEKVVMYDNVEKIGVKVFENCEMLVDIKLSKGLKKIGERAFNFCRSIKEIAIPGSLKETSLELFFQCYSLKKVVIEEGVEVIASSTFSNLTSLETVTLPNSLTFIGDNAFTNTGIREIIIPSSVHTVDHAAFDYCVKLEKVTLGEGIKNLYCGFYGCDNLKYINIPNSISSLSDGFARESLLLEFNEYDGGLYLGNDTNKYKVYVKPKDKNQTFYYINKNTDILVGEAFKDCKNLISMEIPSKITYLGSCMFFNCTSLEYIVIPKNIQHIGISVFYKCSSLQKVTLAEGIETIGSSAFGYCTSLSVVNIPDSVKRIGTNIFDGCKLLPFTQYENAIYFGGEDNKFKLLIKAISTDIANCKIHKDTKIISSGAFGYCELLTEIEIPEGVIGLSESLFAWCSRLSSIILPQSIKYIDIFAICNCAGLKNIYFRGSKEQWDEIVLHEYEKKKIETLNIIYNYQN